MRRNQTNTRLDNGDTYVDDQKRTSHDISKAPPSARLAQSAASPSVAEQQSFWNSWNEGIWKSGRGEISRRQEEIVLEWLNTSGRRDNRILEVGCGSGWLCPKLAGFGEIVGTDLSDDVLQRARQRWPYVRFVAGDFLSLSIEPNSFDVVVSLEVLSHVPDHNGFMRRVADLLKPNGALMLATQNGPVLRDHCIIPPPSPGQLRRWVDRSELAALAEPYFAIEELFSVTPTAHKGARRLLTSQKVNALLRPVIGDWLRNALEARDWGWTLMLKARKRSL